MNKNKERNIPRKEIILESRKGKGAINRWKNTLKTKQITILIEHRQNVIKHRQTKTKQKKDRNEMSETTDRGNLHRQQSPVGVFARRLFRFVRFISFRFRCFKRMN